MKARLRAATVVVGFSGLAAEILLLRELLIVFSGNELSIGIILANWLILEAFGSYFLGRTVERWKNKPAAFTLISILFSLFFILVIFPLRNLKHLLGVSIGEIVGLLPIFYSSFLILLPVSVLHGALFTYSSRIYSLFAAREATSAGRVYVYETVGTLLGGIASTYLFLRYLNTFESTSLVLLLHVISGLVLLLPYRDTGRLQKGVLVLLLVLLPVSGYLLLGGVADRLHRYSVDKQWRNLDVVHYQNSQYGNVCVVENEGQFIYFVDGTANLIVPVPDLPSVEEYVHIPLLTHPDPEEVLVIGGGAGGVLDQALKHRSIESVTYVELDPLILSLLREFPTALTESELTDGRVEIKHGDGRFHLQTASRSYDVIFVGIDEPSNLQANRFFTREFYSLAEKRLTEGGILVAQAPGSLSLANEELQDLNSSIFHTLHSEFSNIRVIPGEGRNLFLASNSPTVASVDTQTIVQEQQERAISAGALVPWYIEQKLHEGWKQWFSTFIEGRSRRINADFKPLGLFYSISYWNAVYSPAFGRVFDQFERIDLGTVLLLVLLLLLLHFVLRRRSRTHLASGIPFCILTTGFAGMMFDLVVIFAFQSIYGYVFSWMGMLVAAFMAGAAAGAVLLTRALERAMEGAKLFLMTEIALIAVSVVLPLVFWLASGLSGTPRSQDALKVLFLLISFLCGLLTGAQFPLANKLHLERSGSVSSTAGLLYAYDLFGGWVGGIVGGVALLPVLGLTGACVTVGLLKLASLIVIARTTRTPSYKEG
jgi:spermidine synthase